MADDPIELMEKRKDLKNSKLRQKILRMRKVIL